MARSTTPSLTLSQRRALLRGLDAEGRVVRVASPFRAQPFARLVDAGYAVETTPLSFKLTAAGIARAEAINPQYRDWAAGETVAADPSRPVAGEHRAIPTSDRSSRYAWLAHA